MKQFNLELTCFIYFSYLYRSNCDSEAANELRKHYKRPYFLPEVSESSKTDWIFMGCPGYGAHMHVSLPECKIIHIVILKQVQFYYD